MAQFDEYIEARDVKWTPELEVALFHSMHGHKPVGLNKHFHMACIQHKLQHSAGLFLTTKQIWEHLKTLYDLDSLENLEKFPFPNETKEFCLPGYMIEAGSSATEAEETRDNEGAGRKGVWLHSSSLSPASSPSSKSATKRKRN